MAFSVLMTRDTVQRTIALVVPLLAIAALALAGPLRCLEYLSGLDYRLSYPHLAGLTTFFGRLVERGRVPNGTLSFLPAA